MAFHVKVIPPSGRARVHDGSCKFCRDGRGMENQDKGTGPTYWHPPYPQAGFGNVEQASKWMTSALGSRYQDVGLCSYCLSKSANS